jgi:hypothetical protein
MGPGAEIVEPESLRREFFEELWSLGQRYNTAKKGE